MGPKNAKKGFFNKILNHGATSTNGIAFYSRIRPVFKLQKPNQRKFILEDAKRQKVQKGFHQYALNL